MFKFYLPSVQLIGNPKPVPTICPADPNHEAWYGCMASPITNPADLKPWGRVRMIGSTNHPSADPDNDACYGCVVPIHLIQTARPGADAWFPSSWSKPRGLVRMRGLPSSWSKPRGLVRMSGSYPADSNREAWVRMHGLPRYFINFWALS